MELAADGALVCELTGAPGERFELTGWSAGPSSVELAGESQTLRPVRSAQGLFTLPIELPESARCTLRIRSG